MELLVAIGLSAIVAVGLYSISLVASQTFQQQQRISEVQLRLRSAIELLRSDVQRAGYMATPSSVADPSVCPKPTDVIQAVQLLRESSNPTHEASLNAGISPVRLVMTGNYVNTDEYLVMGIQGNLVYLQQHAPAYAQRIASATTFREIFQGRTVRITGTNGQTQFNQVIEATWQSPSGTAYPSLRLVSEPVIIGSGATGCGIAGLGVGATISPIISIQYRIASTATSQPTANVGVPASTTGKTDLVREEVVPNANLLTPIANTQRIAAEYAVDFDVAGVFDTGIGLEPVHVRHPFGAENNFLLLGVAGAGASAPHRLRALSVRLSVRDRVQDPDFAWVARGDGGADPLTRFKVMPNQIGAARVRSVTTEITLPNLAYRNVR